MLELKSITKDYVTGDSKVKALKGVSISFRKSEFVSILGPSGCGKTTLLNIIGGLDRYTSGDLIINEKSTKEFTDRDWDAYRNYSVGFVFQNYNLIPHQTVLSNVELALTLSGVSKEERRKKATKALEQVGLKDQINKKPNQLSGGQMQRVAIARALVNDPDIILADEPTGALDTKTSIQIMEILKKISKNKLIVMVTHNPEIAEKYSSRIIKVLDGKVTEDSNPFDESQKINKDRSSKKLKTSMNFITALSLSFNNLLTKKGRTILTAFAGSIGIIGIALILSLSNGVHEYINKVEEDTLSSYPITIEETTIDMSSMMGSFMEETSDIDDREANKLYSKNIMSDMMTFMSSKVESNNLEEFKKYLDDKNNLEIQDNVNAIEYSYNLNLNLYKENTEDGVVRVNPSTVMEKIGFGDMMQAETTNGMMSSMGMMSTDVWTKLLDNEELLKSQYDVLAGKFPEKYNEVVLMVTKDNEISDYTLYALGLLDQDNLEAEFKKLTSGEELEKLETKVYSYDEILGLSYKLILNTDYYANENNVWVNKSEDEDYMKQKIKDAESIKIVGIVKINDETVANSEYGRIGYTKELEEYVINKINEAEIVKKQKENQNINVFTGLKFPEEGASKNFDYSSLSLEERQYLQTLSQAELAKLMETYSANAGATYDSNLEKLGSVDLNKPKTINIYAKDFEAKELIADAIENYNTNKEKEGKEEDVINYTDVVGLMMNSVTTIIDVISYVLIAFVAISLVVSSIMIGIITYISVLERTKEIGILRAIGASKKDISRVFNAETFIVGLVAGLLGIGVTVLLNIPINIIIKNLVGISTISVLPLGGAIVLVVISMLLTVIAGLVPSKMASKKDPVEALRTE